MTTARRKAPEARTRHRVIKTLSPGDKGAQKWTQKFGESLICVRYRSDGRGKVRYTTVELLVEAAPIRPRTLKAVYLKVPTRDRITHEMIRVAGGRWNDQLRLWRLPSRVATILNLRQHIVDPDTP